MRVGLISDHASPLVDPGAVDAGGQNVYVERLAHHLTSLGHHVDVFTRRDDPSLAPIVALHRRLRVIHVDAGPARMLPKEALLPFMRTFTEVMARWCRTTRYDVLHANFWMSGSVALALQHRFGIPVAVTFHALGTVRRRQQGDADRSPARRVSIEERIVRGADRIIAECPHDEADLILDYGAEPERIAMVPAGFEPREFPALPRDAARAALGLSQDAPVVTHVGRLVRRKGIEDLMQGFAGIAAEAPDARLVIAGGHAEDAASREERERLGRIAGALGLGDAVRFDGQAPRDRLAAYYRAADVFATTPWYEPFGITPLEAMACGRPVVGSDVGGISFTVRHGETGLLVEPRSPAAIADALQTLLALPTVRERMGDAAMRRVYARFTWAQIAREIEGVYGEAIAARRCASVAPAPVGLGEIA